MNVRQRKATRYQTAKPRYSGWRGFRIAFVLSLVCHGWFGLTVFGAQINLPFPVDEISQYQHIGTATGDDGAAINLQQTEFGANKIFVSNSDPNLASTFAGRWDSTTNRTTGSVPASAPVFEGVDYTGHNAILSATGRFTVSGTDIYADEFAVRCSSPDGTNTGQCRNGLSSPGGSRWITPPAETFSGNPGNGAGVVGNYDHSSLITELEDAWTYINGLTAEATISVNKGTGSSTTNIDAADTNGDGVAVIDIDKGDGSDFDISNHDWILNGDGSTFGIFRVRYDSDDGSNNFLMSNSSIALGPGGIGNGSDSTAPNRLGAIFVHYEAPSDSSNTVFNLGGNVILNGVGFWDLNPFRNGTYDEDVGTFVDVSNGQGCSHFIGSKVQHTSSSRFSRCTPEAVPEPTGWAMMLLGVWCLGASRR